MDEDSYVCAVVVVDTFAVKEATAAAAADVSEMGLVGLGPKTTEPSGDMLPTPKEKLLRRGDEDMDWGEEQQEEDEGIIIGRLVVCSGTNGRRTETSTSSVPTDTVPNMSFSVFVVLLRRLPGERNIFWSVLSFFSGV
jgi:hypothetical protein